MHVPATLISLSLVFGMAGHADAASVCDPYRHDDACAPARGSQARLVEPRGCAITTIVVARAGNVKSSGTQPVRNVGGGAPCEAPNPVPARRVTRIEGNTHPVAARLPRTDRDVAIRPVDYPATLIATAAANSTIPGGVESRVKGSVSSSDEEGTVAGTPGGKGLLILSGLLAALTVARRRIA